MKTWSVYSFRRIGILVGLLSAGYLVACYGDNIDSVHFYGSAYDNKQNYDFGRVPQEVIMPGWTNEPVRTGSSSGYNYDWYPEFDERPLTDYGDDHKRDEIDGMEARFSRESFWGWPDDTLKDKVHAARHLEVRHQFKLAAEAFQKVGEARRFKAFGTDREELIATGALPKTKGYTEYLKLRYLIEFGYPAERTRAINELKSLDADPKITPHIRYALASAMEEVSRSQRAEAFLAIAKEFPRSKRAESALVMAGRAYLEAGTDEKAGSVEWQKGLSIFNDLLKRYPRSRFRSNIEGWRGGYEMSQKRIIAAIPHYIIETRSNDPREAWKGHQALANIAFGDSRPLDAVIHLLQQRAISTSQVFKVRASSQIRKAFNGFRPKDAQKIQARIATDARLLSAYLDFRLEDTQLDLKQERQLASYVNRSLRHVSPIPAEVSMRLAQVQYHLGRYSDATASARKAIRAGGEIGARARFIEAGALDRLGRHQQSIAKYEALYKLDVPDYLHRTCAEQLAFLHEKYGDPTRSYKLYDELRYGDDLAFVVDSELTPRQIASLIPRAKDHEERAILKYSLAMRYFRQERYSEARRILEKLPSELRLYKGISGPSFVSFVGHRFYDEHQPKQIDPLDDVITMQRFRNQAESARSQEARAKALYGLVHYVHERRNLMYYSAGLWIGCRATAYSIYWNDKINKGRFQRIANESALEHECDAQVLKFCRELIRRCPKSSYVPKALYSAGVACNSLGRFNGFWGYIKEDFGEESVRFMQRVAREYPHDSLAKPAKKYAAVFADEDIPEY